MASGKINSTVKSDIKIQASNVFLYLKDFTQFMFCL